jgi:hypothetical protein
MRKLAGKRLAACLALDESELGALLICETDFDIAATNGGEVGSTRGPTINARPAELHDPLQVRAAIAVLIGSRQVSRARRITGLAVDLVRGCLSPPLTFS